MNRMFTLLGGGILAAGLSVSAFAHNGEDHSKAAKDGEEGKSVTIQGELIDTACYVSGDGDAKGKDHASCAKKCMGSGIPAGILPEGSKDAHAMMYLLTNSTVLAPYAAQTIKVEGESHPDMHAIDVKKLYVKDGEKWKEVKLSDEHHKMSGESDAKDDGHKDHDHK